MGFSKEEKREYAKRMNAYRVAGSLLGQDQDDEAMDVLRDLVDGIYPDDELEDE